MFNPVALAAFAVLASSTAVTQLSTHDAEPMAVPATLDWSVSPAGDKAEPSSVEFMIGYRTPNHSSTNSHDVPLQTLNGLTAAQLASPGQPVGFAMRHDAGDFRCAGVAGQGRGTGTCVFAPNAGFPAALRQRGVGQPDAYQTFSLAMQDIGLAYVDELKHEGYATPTPDDLVKAGEHGAGMRTLKAMDAAGYRFGTVAELVRVRDHGVSARYIEEMKGYGYAKLGAEDLVRLRDHGVSARYVGELRGLGYAPMAAEDMVHLRDHGVSTGFLTELRSLGYEKLPPETLARMRDHGISAGFIRRANRDGQKLSPDELIRLRDTGGRE